MKCNKILLLITAASVASAATVGIWQRPRAEPSVTRAETVAEGDDCKIFVTSVGSPEGRWLTLVPWEEIRDLEGFDEVVPFCSTNRVLAVKDGKCAVISRRTATERINAALRSSK
jgi:hypothetical protein